jgi:acetamidase/formamidase
MIKGDKGVESIYAWGAKMGIDTRGASGQGDGVHILTGPIYVCGAEPGDVLQVRRQDAQFTAAPGHLHMMALLAGAVLYGHALAVAVECQSSRAANTGGGCHR